MHPVVFDHYERLLARFSPGDCVLELGSIPETAGSYARLLPGRDYIGVSLEPPSAGDRWRIITANAHELPFDDASVDAVICNAMLEHDPRFWETLAETRRVLTPRGLFFVGSPGFSARLRPWRGSVRIRVERLLPTLKRFPAWEALIVSTLTYQFHAAPDDYWRFSPSAFRDVILDGFDVLALDEVFTPPRIIAVGRLRR